MFTISDRDIHKEDGVIIAQMVCFPFKVQLQGFYKNSRQNSLLCDHPL